MVIGHVFLAAHGAHAVDIDRDMLPVHRLRGLNIDIGSLRFKNLSGRNAKSIEFSGRKHKRQPGGCRFGKPSEIVIRQRMATRAIRKQLGVSERPRHRFPFIGHRTGIVKIFIVFIVRVVRRDIKLIVQIDKIHTSCDKSRRLPIGHGKVGADPFIVRISAHKQLLDGTKLRVSD